MLAYHLVQRLLKHLFKAGGQVSNFVFVFQGGKTKGLSSHTSMHLGMKCVTASSLSLSL